jgi:hypothetical protein
VHKHPASLFDCGKTVSMSDAVQELDGVTNRSKSLILGSVYETPEPPRSCLIAIQAMRD